MTWEAPSRRETKAILDRARTIALVGASADPSRASYFVATYLLSSSTTYEVLLVNPKGGDILGHPVHRSLAELGVVPDIVDVFRRREDLGAAADEAIAVGAPVLWFQLGLRDDAVAERAEAEGLRVVQDRCLKIEHARWAGGLHLAGFDTGVVDSRRSPAVRP
jgi:predicted CoA-binding protein